MALRFDDKVVVVTGSGGGLGKAYALFYASRGASVVVNDLGRPGAENPADLVVAEIKKNGGKAVANYDSVEEGEKIIETAVKAFGTVHIIINNAGILRDSSFNKLTKANFDLVYNIHLNGAYKVTKAAWPYLRKQKFGRIINTASPAGLYGNFGQSNYGAAKLGLVGFMETLAKEGAKYNITANAIAPLAASRMTEGIMPPEILEQLKPEFIVPLVAFLTHESTNETYGIYELAAGFFAKVRWERGNGHIFKTDSSFTPSAILNAWDKVIDFSKPEYPSGPADFFKISEISAKTPPAKQGPEVSFKDQVVIVTGAGAGIGRSYALLLGKLGAKVVVNDFANPQGVVDEIKAAGGTAVADNNNVVDGGKVVKTAIDAFGTVHAILNNAGILRDKSFLKLTDSEWNIVQEVHLKGTAAVTQAAWPYFLKQGYGRVVNTTSTSGIYGNFGQANYAAAKAAILGLTKTLAQEGGRKNIFVNAIAPNAGTAMTASVFTPEMLEAFKPEYIAPLVVLLASDKSPVTGQLFETGSGWIGQTRLQRAGGVVAKNLEEATPEWVKSKISKISDFNDGKAININASSESAGSILQTVSEFKESLKSQKNGNEKDYGINATTEYEYNHRDLILYNIGVGATAKELKYTFENDDNFTVIPTFGVIPSFPTLSEIDFSGILPNFNPMKLLHGEQYLEIKQWPIPTSGKFKNNAKIIEVVDKVKAAVAVSSLTTTDENNNVVFYGESTTFIRDAGGFGGPKTSKDRGIATAANVPPKRTPDFTGEYKTSVDQAALYRLSGDYNPLHIDPEFAAVGKFPRPILHGLCSFGISGKILFDKFGPFKNIKTRFSGHVFPGETLRVEAWKEGSKVIFITKVVERGTLALSSAAIELLTGNDAKL